MNAADAAAELQTQPVGTFLITGTGSSANHLAINVRLLQVGARLLECV
jgi:hypothetical protein